MTPPTTLPAKSPRTRTLPVAEIFSFARAERLGGEAIVTVLVGDAEHQPHLHGLRAPESRWVEIVTGLAAADPVLAARIAGAVAQVQAAMPVPDLRAPIEKPSGGLL